MRWGLLVRISEDRAGEALGVARQEEDGRALVAARGGQVAELYRENDTSAYKRRVITLPDGSRARRVVRPEFRRALDDLHGGRIDALCVYDLDRLTRDPRDLEDLIDVVEETGRPATSVTGSLDLSTDHGITMARVQCAIANKSSRDTARRVERKHLEIAAAGRPTGGRRPYGYEKDRTTVVPAEAAVIREIARRRLAGETWLGIAIDLNRRAVPTVTGTAWNVVAGQRGVQKPHVVGLRFHRGREVAAGTWPPILDRGTWQALRATPGQLGAQPHRRYLLSGLARCGRCGGRMGAGRTQCRGGPSIPRYRCQQTASCPGVSRNMEHLDEFVAAAVLELLADLDPPQPAVDDGLLSEVAALRARRRAVEDAFSDLSADPPAVLRRNLEALDGQITRLEARAAQGARGRVLDGARGLSRERWDALPLDRRRAIVAELLVVTVFPGRRGRGFDADSVRLDPAY